MASVAVRARGLDVMLRQERHTVRSLREYCVRRLRGERIHERADVRVLTDVSLEVAPGRLLAVIGPNGAGKTTLLRVLAGIVPPSAGDVVVNGRVAPLIELGAGFDPELTGVENVLLYGSLLGARPSDLRRGLDAITEFAGLETMMDTAVRHYSTGMIARLGFAVATAVRPSVLLVDEVLSVGDGEFRSRCTERIHDLRAEGCAVVCVTHDLALVRAEADACLLLRHGSVAAAGIPSDVIGAYEGRLAS
jgi:ABC-type polysaccharide/polyol phosphate transport system ATPase subunit